MKVNWELQGCCDHEQRIFLVAIDVFTIVILLISPLRLFLLGSPVDRCDQGSDSVAPRVFLQLWKTFLLTLFKLITVFLHGTSQALTCKHICGNVTITIYDWDIACKCKVIGSVTIVVLSEDETGASWYELDNKFGQICLRLRSTKIFPASDSFDDESTGDSP